MVGFDHEKTLHYSDSFIAGFLGGIVTRATVSPLDVVKIRFQLQPEKGRSKLKYVGFSQAIRTIYKEEGFRAFWKGHMPAQCLSMIYGGCQFSSFQYFTELANRFYPHTRTDYTVTTVTHFGCGCLSGAIASVAAQPVDVLRTRFAAQKEPMMYPSVFGLGRRMLKLDGIKGFYRGLTPALTQVVPYSGFQFSSYTMLESLWLYVFNKKDRSSHFFCGALAGITSKTLVYPLDVAKKRLQVQGFSEATVSTVINYEGFRHCMISIFKNEGVSGLYKGLSAAMLKSGTTSGLIFLTYEFFSDFLRLKH